MGSISVLILSSTREGGRGGEVGLRERLVRMLVLKNDHKSGQKLLQIEADLVIKNWGRSYSENRGMSFYYKSSQVLQSGQFYYISGQLSQIGTLKLG